MGNDGGSLPTRREQVRIKKKEVADSDSISEGIRTKWQVCALKKERFGQAIVADLLGNLFDKGNVVRGLVEKSLPPQFSHIKSLKDLIDIHFTLEEKVAAEHQMGQTGENFMAPFICPIIQRPANGKYGTCGHACSDKGLRNSKLLESQNNCFVCGKSYTVEDILPLNPNEEQLALLRGKLDQILKEKKAEKSLKKVEKKKKREEDGAGREEKKRKVDTTTTGKSDRPVVQNSVTIKKAMKDAGEVHQKTKKSSEAYHSIFAQTGAQPLPNFTGLYRR